MKLTLFAVFYALTISYASSQEASPSLISASGNLFYNNDIVLSWSVGEVAVETYLNSGLILTQGFHQPDVKQASNNAEYANISSLRVYPNPTRGKIHIDLGREYNSNLQYKIVNSQGIELSGIEPLDKTGIINFNQFAEGIYILQLFNNSKQLSATKLIQKLN